MPDLEGRSWRRVFLHTTDVAKLRRKGGDHLGGARRMLVHQYRYAAMMPLLAKRLGDRTPRLIDRPEGMSVGADADWFLSGWARGEFRTFLPSTVDHTNVTQLARAIEHLYRVPDFPALAAVDLENECVLVVAARVEPVA